MMILIGTCGPVVSVFGQLRYDTDISMPVYSFASDKHKTLYVRDIYQGSELF